MFRAATATGIDGVGLPAFQVPDGWTHEVDAMHEWCNDHDFHDWEGDETGLTIIPPRLDAEYLSAPIGYWIVKHGPQDFRPYGVPEFQAAFTTTDVTSI